METIGRYRGRLKLFEKRYSYQAELTKSLDRRTARFKQSTIDEIALWKVNRYAALRPGTLNAINRLSALKPREHRKGASCLSLLLGEDGVDLPMASSILRFRNPAVFQIIDRRAYRAIYGVKYPLHRSTPDHRKIKLYFDYLDALWKHASRRRIRFRKMDRVLYVFDKEKNGLLGS